MANQTLYTQAKKLIPGGTQLLSKRPEMFLPDNWINYYEEAKGCELIDIEGNKFYDFITMGIGTCTLGYADEDVNNAVKKCIDKGNMTSLNCPEEVELAKLLTSLHSWADMARFTRSGGEAMTVAVRIARAYAGKDKILFCGYHGWHDWYISANLSHDKTLDGHLLPGLEPKGIVRELAESAIPFSYNNTEEFLNLIHKYNGEIGVIVLEAVRNTLPEKEFLDTIQKVAKEKNIVILLDEITSGFRLNVGGAHLLYGLEPDIAVFAKAISNGYPMGAIIGKKHIMEYAQTTFISSTYWTERIGSVAALTTINKMLDIDLPKHLIHVGKRVQEAWFFLAQKHNLKIHISGIYPLSHFAFETENPLLEKTVYTKLMLEHGFLASTVLYTALPHTDELVETYIKASDICFAKISTMSDTEKMNCIDGKICHSTFKRLN